MTAARRRSLRQRGLSRLLLGGIDPGGQRFGGRPDLDSANSRTTCCPRRCRLGGVGPGRTPPRGRATAAGAAPRASAWARSPNIDLDLRTCTYRRPSGDEQVISWDRLVFAARVGQPPGSHPGPGRARLLMLPTWAATSGRAGLGGRCRHAPRHPRTRLARPHEAAGCQGRGALVADTGPPPTQVGRLHHSGQVDRRQKPTRRPPSRTSARSWLQAEIRRKGRPRSAMPAR